MAARVTNDALILQPSDPVRPFEDSEPIALAVPGTTPLPWAAGVITAKRLGIDCWGLAGDGRPCLRTPTPGIIALIDLCRVIGPLNVRPPRPGDRIQPLGMAGHRKLQDLLTDRKVPRATRRRLPVVCDAESIVWVAGYCISEAAKVREATSEVLLLGWEPGG